MREECKKYNFGILDAVLDECILLDERNYYYINVQCCQENTQG